MVGVHILALLNPNPAGGMRSQDQPKFGGVILVSLPPPGAQPRGPASILNLDTNTDTDTDTRQLINE